LAEYSAEWLVLMMVVSMVSVTADLMAGLSVVKMAVKMVDLKALLSVVLMVALRAEKMAELTVVSMAVLMVVETAVHSVEVMVDSSAAD
jgi:hypothetical protein